MNDSSFDNLKGVLFHLNHIYKGNLIVRVNVFVYFTDHWNGTFSAVGWCQNSFGSVCMYVCIYNAFHFCFFLIDSGRKIGLGSMAYYFVVKKWIVYINYPVCLTFLRHIMIKSDFRRIYKIDEKAIIKNRYNRIPHPTLNTKRERNTIN